MRTLSIDPFFRRLFMVTALVISLYLLYAMSSVIIPFVSAFILAYFFNPLVSKLTHVMPRWASILVVYSVIFIVFLLTMWWLLPAVWSQLQAAWDYLPAGVRWFNEIAIAKIQQYIGIKVPELKFQGLSETLLDYLKRNYDVEDAQSLFKQVFSSSLKVLNNAGLVLLIPVLVFYYLIGWDARLDKWHKALPQASKNKIVEIVGECNQALMSFVKGQLLVMFLLGVIYAIELQLIGLELGLIIGMIAGLASFVPYLGFGIGIVAALVAGLFQFGLDWVSLGLIIIAFAIGQVIEGYVLQPFLLGDKIGLSPLWVMFAVLAGAALMGVVGMLIALPVSAIINVLFRHGFEAYLKSSWYKGSRQLKLFD